MKVVVVSASPNRDGLTASCAEAALEGLSLAGGSGQDVRLNQLEIGLCRACEKGWGTCREEHRCQTEDDFQELHEVVRSADGLVLVTPVYWGDLSESAKAFTDRIRRCEAPRGAESALHGMPVISVAAAGGSGRGTITCLLNLDRWVQHVGGRSFDLISVTRWSRSYKIPAIRAAAQAVVNEALGAGQG